MAFVIADRVQETTTTAGTGTITLAGASTGFQSFAAIGNGNNTYYTIAGRGTSEWEVGIGTYSSSGTTLSRDTVLSSSNSGNLVNFSAGTKDVFVTPPSSRSLLVQSAGSGLFAGTTAFTANGAVYASSTSVLTSGTLPVASGGTGLTSGTSGGIPYYSASATIASSAALAANALVIGGGAGAAPSTTTTGTGVLTALGTAVGSAGAFVVNGGALGTPLSGTLTNATGLPLTTGVTGILPIANGGTNSSATATAGGIGYGTGTAHAYTSAGTSGQVLTSAAASAPTWTTATSANTASAIVQRDASGNFSAGTITATLSGNASTATTATNQSGGTVSATTGSFSSTVSFAGGSGVSSTGDIVARRSSGTTGVYYFVTQGGSVYLYYDGTNFSFNGGSTLNQAGAFVATGNVTAYSDERLKTDWKPVAPDFVQRMATEIKYGTYTRTDSNERHGGVSAQDWRKLLPETVVENKGFLTIAYGNAALVACMELAKEVVALRARVAALEAKGN